MLARKAMGTIVRNIRKRKKLTLADLNGYISVGHLSEFERGENELSSELLALVAQGLGVTAWYIMVEAGHLLRESERAERMRQKGLVSA